jgi:cytochrome c peroxidase
MRNPIELGRDPTDVAQELHGYPAYATLFAAAFPGEADPITADNLARALAAFERTLVSDDAPFDRWVRGDRGAIGDDELRGWVVFNEARCGDCHAPPLFESERYETSPAPAVPGVPDDGRFAVTGREEDRGRFRVPTLRNLRTTQPYFHNGTAEDLHDAIALEAGARAPRALTAGELGDLYAFLYKSLVDMTRLPARPRVAPSGLPVPTDTLEIPRWYDGGTEQ